MRELIALRRVALFLLCYFAILVLASRLKGMVPPAWGQFAWGAASAATLLGMTLLFLRRERRPARDAGLQVVPASVARLAAGLVIGAAVYLVNFGVVYVVAGPITIAPAGNVTAGAIALAVATYLALSCMEELGFRGYALRTLDTRLGLWPAQWTIAMAFALSHVAFGWPWQNVVFGVLPNALLFGLAAIASRGLAMPIGVHAGVNIARWAFGEAESPGPWTMSLSPEAGARVSAVAPYTGIAVTLLAALGFWYWHRLVGKVPAAGPSPRTK